MNFQFDLVSLKKIAIFVGVMIIAVIVAWALTLVNKHIFKKIQQKKSGLHVPFFQRITSILIFATVIILTVSAFDGASSLWKTMLGGTAILSAVLAFAAQDVIKDILAGLMLSINRPFEIGDRIALEDGTAGIVEDMTMRHVVLISIDTLRLVIPNSKINEMKITNFSFHSAIRSVNFKFSIGYDSDVELAKQVIFNAIKESKLTVPRPNSSGKSDYSPVYFLEFADSALIMTVTVYYNKTSPTEVVKNEINTKVREALVHNGIEIPYNYVTVVNK